jgi:hypothetical protein
MNELEKMLLGGDRAIEWLSSQATALRLDDSTPIQRVIEWQGFKIGLQYLPFEQRHGKMLVAGYGHIQKTKGADGMAVDCYVSTNLDSPKVFAIAQMINGEFDEEKIIIGVANAEEASSIYLKAMPKEFFGGIREMTIAELREYRTDAWREERIDAIFTDKELHDAIVKEARNKFNPYPSRYAGYWISQEYKKRYTKKHKRTGGIRTEHDIRLDFACGVLPADAALKMLGYGEISSDAIKASQYVAEVSSVQAPGASMFTYGRFAYAEELEERDLEAGVGVFEISRRDRPELYAIGFDNEQHAEETYLKQRPDELNFYLGVTQITDEDAYRTHRVDSAKVKGNLCRGADGRFISCGATTPQIIKTERITSKTNLAQLKTIADRHGIQKPSSPHKRSSWKEAIASHPEGKQYFETKRSSTMNARTVFTASTDKNKINKDLASWDYKELKPIIDKANADRQLNNAQGRLRDAIADNKDKRVIDNLSKDVDFQQKRVNEAKARVDELIPPNSPYLKASGQTLSENARIGSVIKDARTDEKIAVYDSKGNLSAAATIILVKESKPGEPPHLFVDYLATAPWNLADTDKKVKGAGTEVLLESIRLSKKEGMNGRIKLIPVDNSFNFYEKLGFQEIKNSFTWELSPKQADILLSKFGG